MRKASAPLTDSASRTSRATAPTLLPSWCGPTAVTLRDLGERAGVSHNARYKHFRNQQVLLAAIASSELHRQAGAMGKVARRTTSLHSLPG